MVFEPQGPEGKALAESTFHHFADYNWDIRKGAPSFVAEPPRESITRDPSLLGDTKAFCRNLAAWLPARRMSVTRA